MKKILFASLSLAALSLAAVLSWWLWHVGHQTQEAVASYATTAGEATRTLKTTAATLQEAQAALRTARATIASYEGRSQAWEALAKRESAALRGQFVWAQLMEVRPVRDAAVKALASVPPAVSDARKLIGASDGLITKATPQIIGLAAGWKQAGGFSAATIRMVQPDLKVMTTEGAKAAPTLRKTAENVERITRPPNIFVRIFGPIVKLLF